MTSNHRRTYPSAMACLVILALLNVMAPPANASYPYSGNTKDVNLTSIAAAPNGGFWVQIDGAFSGGKSRTLAIDGAPQFENVPVAGTIVAYPRGVGYWVVGGDGHIYARGAAPELCEGYLGNCTGFPPPYGPGPFTIVAASAAPDGQGFWAIGQDGTLWTVGDAPWLEIVSGQSTIPTAIAGTPSGKGYYIVYADGGVFAFGDAVFYGSTGGKKPGGHNTTGIALSYNASGEVNGYWMVFDDGGVFTFGQARFLGSTGGKDGGSVVTGIVARPNRLGYAWVHANGGVELSNLPNVVITSKQFGTVIGPLYGGTETGAPLRLLVANDKTSQQWELRPTAGGVAQPGSVVQLINVNSGLCADVTGPDPTDSRIIQWPCKTRTQGWENQIWRMTNQNGVTQFIYYGQPADQPHYTLAADTDGSLFLEFSDNDNPGWMLSGAP